MRTDSILHPTGAIDHNKHAIARIAEVIVMSTGDTRSSPHAIVVGTGAVVGGPAAFIALTGVSANEFDRIGEIARDR